MTEIAPKTLELVDELCGLLCGLDRALGLPNTFTPSANSLASPEAAQHLDVVQSCLTEQDEQIKALQRTNEYLVEQLKKANEQAEHFERLWYLHCDLSEELLEALILIAYGTCGIGSAHIIAREAIAKAKAKK